MARPKNITELLILGRTNYNKLISYVDGQSKEEQNKTFSSTKINRKIRYVLAQLHHWHLMMMSWHDEGMSAKKPDTAALGYFV